MEQPSDQHLIERTLDGDQTAFALLVERYGRVVYARISRTVRSSDDIQDLVQDVFLAAYTRLRQLKARKRFPAWLRAIADNTARMWHRRRFVQLRWEEMFENQWSSEIASSDDEAETQRLRTIIRAALRTLSVAHQQVIVYHYFKGYSYSETAELLDLKVDTVRSRLQKARHRLRKEPLSMNDQAIQSQTFELMREDLNALRWAGVYASRDESGPVLQGICLDAGGRMVATDGHRLLLWTSESLNEIGAPVLLESCHGIEIPDADRATLSVGVEEAVLRVPGEKDRTIPVMEGPYPKYEKVFPTTWTIRATLTTGALLEAVDLIADHLAPQHPVAPEGAWEYHPQVEIRVSVPEQVLSLITTRDMGYVRETPDGKKQSYRPQQEDAEEKSPSGVPDWTFIASIQAQIETHDSEELFRSAVDYVYWRDVVHALQADRNEALEIRFIDPLKVILCTPVRHPNRKTLLMPLRMETE